MLEHYAVMSGADPRRASDSLVVLPYVDHTFRAWTVVGGMHRLVDALHQRVIDRGAVVVVGSRAAHIATSAGRVRGVRLADGSTLPADVVVSDVDVEVLHRDLLGSPRSEPSTDRASSNASVFTLLLGLRDTTPDVRRHSVYFTTDTDAELSSVFGRDARPPDDASLSVTVTADEATAPSGCEAWAAHVTVPRHGSGAGACDWGAAGVAASYADHVVALLDALVPGLRDRVVSRTHLSPADLERSTGSPGGAVHGYRGLGPGRGVAPSRSPVAGLFTVGSSAHPGGGVPFVTQSAAIVAEMVGRA
jgi:phytoene dehydrogenase-like protein